ncbi:MAG: 4Fe-4S binding protein [Sulfurovaceae bacterium]|nr:4Fe-4S binding protein [Sulfurovaceae bacterium]
MKLNFNLSSCVRSSAINSNCQRCIDICPTNTIKIENNIPIFTPDECISCGGCVGICPTSAYSLDNFNMIEFIFNHFQTNEVLSCRQNTPCLATFSIEALITLSLGNKENITLDIGHCATCEIAKNLYPQIKNNINEANFILSTFSQKKIEEKELGLESIEKTEVDTRSRRDFFSNLKPTNLIKTKIAFDEKIDGNEAKKFNFDENTINQIKTKFIPDIRKLFFTLMKNQDKPKIYETINSDEISFISQKYIDQSKCTNCQICYRICPTEALNSDKNFSIINFNSILCLKCYLCHDVCEYDAIHVQKEFDIKEFFEPTNKILAEFDIKRCDECGNHFTYFGGDFTCPRCKTEEEEALALHNIFKKDFQ